MVFSVPASVRPFDAMNGMAPPLGRRTKNYDIFRTAGRRHSCSINLRVLQSVLAGAL
jgi:hypothetical protein